MDGNSGGVHGTHGKRKSECVLGEEFTSECETDEIGFANRGEVYLTKVREENVLR